MNAILAYGLMVVSASFYCSFDAVVKEKTFQHSNNQTAVFSRECEIQDCLGKTLNIFKDGKLIEDGFLSAAAVLTNFNRTAINADINDFSACISEVNQKLNAIPKCSKFQVGWKLLEICGIEKKQHIKLLN